MNKRPQCHRCKFWILDKDSKDDHVDDQIGECHRNAPQASPWKFDLIGELLNTITFSVTKLAAERPDDENFGGLMKDSSFWPLTYGRDWCGEFEVKSRVTS
jgi:hypothetical protein